LQESAIAAENNQRTRHLSFEEEHRLFAEMTGEREYLRPLVTMAIYAGSRRADLLQLRWANVDIDNTITFKEKQRALCADGANRQKEKRQTVQPAASR
jgi:integrase